MHVSSAVRPSWKGTLLLMGWHCCLPGGSSCSNKNSDKRNYCPGPNYVNKEMKCCVWNSQRVCCLPWGSLCRDSADIQTYCPGPNEGDDRTHCCVWDSKPTLRYRTLSEKKENQRLGLLMTWNCVPVLSTLFPSFPFSFQDEEEINTADCASRTQRTVTPSPCTSSFPCLYKLTTT